MSISYILRHLQQMKYDIKLYAIFIGDKGTAAPNRPVFVAAVWEGGVLNFSESW